MTLNQIKGYEYKKFIKKFLIDQGNEAWLWNDIPEIKLREVGLLSDWNEYRLIRKDNKINSLPDLGTDILVLVIYFNLFNIYYKNNFLHLLHFFLFQIYFI
jgi:hypothetical protein